MTSFVRFFLNAEYNTFLCEGLLPSIKSGILLRLSELEKCINSLSINSVYVTLLSPSIIDNCLSLSYVFNQFFLASALSLLNALIIELSELLSTSKLTVFKLLKYSCASFLFEVPNPL